MTDQGQNLFYDPQTKSFADTPPEVSFNEQRIAHHRRMAVMTPGEWITDDYETLQAISDASEFHGKPDGEIIEYNFEGEFWDIFRDVINIAAHRIHLENRLKGFWPDNTDREGSLRLALYPDTHGRNVGEALMLCTSEHGEGLEAFRKGGLEKKDDKLPERSGLFTEMGDDLIRVLDFTGGLDADIGSIIVEKRAYNTTRPYKHGKTH